MGTLFSALGIGRSGLLAAQVQLDVAGNNIANVNTPGFSRQRVELEELFPISTPNGTIGRGVGIATIQRLRDDFLDTAYVRQVAGLGNTEVQAQYYNLIEDAYLEPGENGFGTRLELFFDALADFSNNVESLPVREAFLAEAESAASELNQLIARFDQLRTNANEEVRNLVPEINSLAERIYEVNLQIRDIEGSGRTASALRDQRGLLLDQLGKLINVSYQEDDSGQVQVQIGSEILVDATGFREITAFRNSALDPERQDLVELRWVDTNGLVEVTNGEVFGALTIRDTVIPEQDARIDEIARALIYELNKIQSQGRGTEALEGTISSTNGVTAATDPLVSAGLPFTVSAGSFDVVVYDASGTPTATTINITAATTLNDLATALNGVANFSASVSGTTLSLGADAGFTYSFGNDTSGVLPALGINSLFNGTDARSITLNPDIADNPGRVTSSYSTDLLNTGDNTAALDMANLRTALVLETGTATIGDFYQSTVALLGIDARSNEDLLLTENEFIQDLETRRQETSGVNLDEEVASLLLFQRAYEASARVMTVADSMLATLLSIAQ
ncbi:MAG: flagellar hook-associated protein FlgK [Candidatus Hydrogenedentes bacterium]|nr:flagellar hook-associated protein FlgK [Candidatus Hydrogenedentota bacterium]